MYNFEILILTIIIVVPFIIGFGFGYLTGMMK